MNIFQNNNKDWYCFSFSEWLHRVKRTRKYVEKFVWSRNDRDSIKICELEVTVEFFVIQALMGQTYDRKFDHIR